MSVDALLRGWDGDRLVLRHDAATDAVVLVGIHSTALGPAMGGTRMKPYPTLEDAVRDVCRLSAAMTLKQAAADLPFGGGKAVIAIPEVPARGSDAWRGLFERYGDLVEELYA